MPVALEDSRLARHLDSGARALLLEGAVRRRFGPGEVVFEEGAVGDGVYVLESGRIEIAGRSMPGRLHRLAIMEPGDYFGEMAVFDGGPRSASAIAMEEVQLHFLPAACLLAVLERTPLLAVELVREGSRRMREFNRRFMQEALKAERLTLVERLARTIVHDFRNPLSVIGLAADLAADPGLPAETRQASRDRIRKQVEALNRMMQELLDFTRGMTPSAALPRVDYAVFIRETLEDLGQDAARRGVKVQGPGTLPAVPLRFDALRLNRVFGNLFQNAFDALEGRPKPAITVGVRIDEETVTTEVSDNGPGIADEVVGQVFQPFVTYGKVHGTGLGLAIADRIVAEHGGRIEAENLPGGGAVFRFMLPRPRPGDTERLAPVQTPGGSTR